MIRVKGISHSYGGGQEIRFPDFEVAKGGKMLLLGQSGSGKTTLLHLLGGLLQVQKGELAIGGQHFGQGKPMGDKFRGRHIGIVFQKPHFVRSLNVLENLLLSQQLAGLKADKSEAMELLESLNISHKARSHTRRLSQGEQQRVAIARALINRPDVILADEPTSALDDGNTQEVIALLEQQAAKREATLIIVTHDNRLKERFQNRIEL
jgi:putative ABC transport system ATP-binding protein